MNNFAKIALTTIVGLAGLSSVFAADDHGAHHASAGAKEASVPMTDGEVKKIDKKSGKVTIKHGPLVNLGMPGMTMAFRIKDAAQLDQLKPGDKIKFVADKVDGVYTVVQLAIPK